MMETASDVAGERTAAGGTRHGVVFVHGVGAQRKSDTLLDFGEPLLAWVVDWYAARGAASPRAGAVTLGFAPVDTGEADALSRAKVCLPNGDEWVWTEAWWATSNRRPDFGTMIVWSLGYLWRIILQLVRATQQRIRRLHGQPGSTDPAPWARVVDLMNCFALLVLYPLGALAGYAVLLPLLLLAQVPLPAFQDFVLLRLIRPFLVVNVGEFRTYIVSDLQAANMHRRVDEAVRWLAEEAHCADVTIIAHSEGAVVSFGMLSDPAHATAAGHVRKLITLGAGLNKSWLVEPDLGRLYGPLPPHVYWLDVWASYDPVPAGWLQPPHLASGERAPIYQPSEAVQKLHNVMPQHAESPYPGLAALRADAPTAVYWPTSEQVTNEMNVVSDHGGYFANAEQVLVRLAAEIDAPRHTDSPFWRGDQVLAEGEARTPALTDAVRARRERVSLLALWRGLVVAVGGVSAVLAAETVAGVLRRTGLARLVGDWLSWLRDVAALLPALGGLIDGLVAMAYWLLGAVVVAVPFVVLYLAGRALVWDRLDRQARADGIARIATAGRRPGAAP
ncbi:MAG TPA: hypothetical protein VII06_06845 [Chloroflexota bacterium]|jgi:hypothetical protein